MSVSQEYKIVEEPLLHISELIFFTARDGDPVSESNVAKLLFHLQNNFVIRRTAAFQVKKKKKKVLAPRKGMWYKATSLAVAEISQLYFTAQTNNSEA